MEEIELNHQSLDKFLALKPLYYDKIDTTRMPHMYKKIEKDLKYGKIIHIIGTNGKGTTGRFLATALFKKGFNVGHYSSPHILRFNERIWMNGKDIADSELELAHNRLFSILGEIDADMLSYFEYTTFLAILIFTNCDYIIFEAGLGGEFDATSVFKKELTLVTPIDFDHQSFLGNSIKSIATTKLNIMAKKTIIGYQNHNEVYKIAKKISLQKKIDLIYLEDMCKIPIILKIIKKLKITNYLKDNLALAIGGLIALGLKPKVCEFDNALLFGRISKIAPNIYLDVGHNELAAKAIIKNFEGKKLTLIYNTYKDKNYEMILSILKPIILDIEILELDDERILSIDMLTATLQKLKIRYNTFSYIKESKNYLIFGSFSVANKFLSNQNKGPY